MSLGMWMPVTYATGLPQNLVTTTKPRLLQEEAEAGLHRP